MPAAAAAAMPDMKPVDAALSSIQASPQTLSLLRRLHEEALSEPAYVSTDSQAKSAALDRFVALDPDKCALVYLLLRSSGARYVVEAGTSFGLSTIYLALAVGQNAKAAAGTTGAAVGKVIATENEPTKTVRARAHWSEVPDEEVGGWIELREGDLRETLKTDLPDQVDFLLLDIWTPLALPTLKLVYPKLRTGALVVVDNTVVASSGYKDLNTYLADPANGFKTTTAPYEGGLQISVYIGQ